MSEYIRYQGGLYERIDAKPYEAYNKLSEDKKRRASDIMRRMSDIADNLYALIDSPIDERLKIQVKYLKNRVGDRSGVAPAEDLTNLGINDITKNVSIVSSELKRALGLVNKLKTLESDLASILKQETLF